MYKRQRYDINDHNEGFFYFIIDEARDVSTTEQMSVCVRYIAENKICECFLGFVTLQELTAEALFLKIKEFSNSNGLDIKKCIGQAYDGASVMKGQ